MNSSCEKCDFFNENLVIDNQDEHSKGGWCTVHKIPITYPERSYCVVFIGKEKRGENDNT